MSCRVQSLRFRVVGFKVSISNFNVALSCLHCSSSSGLTRFMRSVNHGKGTTRETVGRVYGSGSRERWPM